MPMPKQNVTEMLETALNQSKKVPSETIGNCLPYLNNYDIEHAKSLIQYLYDNIENQYQEEAPNAETQAFLDKIKFIKDNYHKYL